MKISSILIITETQVLQFDFIIVLQLSLQNSQKVVSFDLFFEKHTVKIHFYSDLNWVSLMLDLNLLVDLFLAPFVANNWVNSLKDSNPIIRVFVKQPFQQIG